MTINLSVNPRDRLQLSTTIEQLINMLDDLEIDPDFEDGGDDEHSLGWTERGPSAFGHNTDREMECEDEGAQCEDEGAQVDDEHSLGWGTFGGQGIVIGLPGQGLVNEGWSYGADGD